MGIDGSILPNLTVVLVFAILLSASGFLVVQKMFIAISKILRQRISTHSKTITSFDKVSHSSVDVM